jgi:hypothetical protein
MLSGLRVAHRLLLIYLLSFASVAYLAYTLVAEKNISIEFARKERGGIAYADVVRQALMSIIGQELDRAAAPGPGDGGGSSVLAAPLAALGEAERAYGQHLDTGALCDALRMEMRQLAAQGTGDLGTGDLRTGDPEARRTLVSRAIKSARMLISRIGDESNLILDPDLDSYYTMSAVMLRLPEAVTDATELTDRAVGVNPPNAADGDPRTRFLLKEGAFNATVGGLISDVATRTDNWAATSGRLSPMPRRPSATSPAICAGWRWSRFGPMREPRPPDRCFARCSAPWIDSGPKPTGNWIACCGSGSMASIAAWGWTWGRRRWSG